MSKLTSCMHCDSQICPFGAYSPHWHAEAAVCVQDCLADSQEEMKQQLGDVQHDVRGVGSLSLLFWAFCKLMQHRSVYKQEHHSAQQNSRSRRYPCKSRADLSSTVSSLISRLLLLHRVVHQICFLFTFHPHFSSLTPTTPLIIALVIQKRPLRWTGVGLCTKCTICWEHYTTAGTALGIQEV